MDFLATNLKHLMSERGMNAHELSRATGIPQPSIYRMTTGETKNPSMPRIKILATYFDVDFETLTEKNMVSEGYTPKPPSEEKYVIVKQYTAKGECGTGELNDHVEVRGGIAFQKDKLIQLGVNEAFAVVIQSSGDSMYPTIPDRSDLLLDTSKTKLEEDRVYAIERAGNGLVIKRAKIDRTGAWYYHSDNPDQIRYSPMYPLDEDMVIGQVMWQGGSGGL